MSVENLIITTEKTRDRPFRPLHRQVYAQVRDAILSGTLRPGDRLPATRELAQTLGLARNTVARAYEDLLVEGYLDGRVGSGTYVATDIVEAHLTAAGGERQGATPDGGTPGHPHRGSMPVDDARIDLRPGTPDWEAFPRGTWLRLLGRALRANAAELRRYGEPGGHFPLREAIARHLAVSRGVAAQAAQVVIVNGSQQAIDLIARLCMRPGDTVAMEDPGYPDARSVLAAAADRLHYVPVDQDGMSVDALERTTRHLSAPRLLYVTPSHQYPTGAVLPLGRRLALLNWAASRDVLIVEDDYDSEFRTPGRIVESLQGLDRSGKVIYVGTFSTVLFPPLRVGYVVLPPGMVEGFVRVKWRADRQTPTLEQLALSDFLQEGHFERHLRRMRRLVSARREAMRSAIEEHLGGLMDSSGSDMGMHVMVRLSTSRTARAAAEVERRIVIAAAERGVAITPAGACFSRQPRHAAFILGYAALDEKRIQEGVRELARAATRVTMKQA